MLEPTNKRPLKVFLCHASTDKAAVRELYQRLTQDGADAWLDKEKLLPGQDWEYEIRKAVRESDVVVVCLSKQFNQAGFRQKEVKWALDTAMEKPEGEIFIIPARLEECDTLESLKKWHWVDLFEEDGYRKLTQALDLRSSRIGAKLIKETNDWVFITKVIILPIEGEIGSLIAIALHQQKIGNFRNALSYYAKALKLSKEKGDTKSQVSILKNLASMYENMGDLVKAAEYFQQAILLRILLDLHPK
jgi:tetratricopeptide (TPR) repeat protein